MRQTPSPDRLVRLRDAVAQAQPRYLRELEQLVHIESGSYDKAGVDRVADWIAPRLAALGASVERHPHARFGDTLVGTFEGRSSGPTVMLIGHMDTVFEAGTTATRRYELRDGRIYGPGSGDMKAGLLLGLHAIEALRAVGIEGEPWLPVGKLIVVANADEEIGSPSSSAIITALAQQADAALVLEGARDNGDIVSARKGMMHFQASISGRAAHAGVEPEKGRNALLEAAHKTIALHALNGRWPGVSVNVGSISGGTRPNIVPHEAKISVDMRAQDLASQEAASAAIMAILDDQVVPDTSCVVEISAHSRPMQKSAASAQLIEMAVGVAAELGFELHDTATGGGSDANTTSGLGVPTLDGLGPIAGGAHTADDHVVLASIVPRVTLLAGLLDKLGRSQAG